MIWRGSVSKDKSGKSESRGGIREKLAEKRAEHSGRDRQKTEALRERIKSRMDSRNSENRGTGQMARPKATRQDKVAGLAERAGKPDRLRREIDNGAVKEARAYVKGWSPQVQTRTQAQYEKLTDRLQATGKTPEQAAGTKAAYYAYRAAAVHEARSELKEALTARDKAARTQDAAGRETAEDRIRNAVAVLALSGARPAELNKGVAVTRTKDGLRFDISGAKVDDRTGRGQEKRSVSVTKEAAEKSPEGRHLLTELRRTGDTRTVTPDGSTDALSRRLGRAGERAGEQHVSAYDYRHAFADRAKADGADKGELARALGHRAEESQAAYGGAGGGGSGGGFSRATASRSVR